MLWCGDVTVALEGGCCFWSREREHGDYESFYIFFLRIEWIEERKGPCERV
jgi:hypothetical protein